MPFDPNSATKLPWEAHTIPVKSKTGNGFDTGGIQYEPSDEIVLSDGTIVPSESEMATMPWEQLLGLRDKAAGNKKAQIRIAPYEHRAYARERGKESPIEGAVIGAVMAPGYYAAKKLGVMPTDDQSTPADINQVVQGVTGAVEGISDYVKENNLESVYNTLLPNDAIANKVKDIATEEVPKSYEYWKEKLGFNK